MSCAGKACASLHSIPAPNPVPAVWPARPEWLDSIWHHYRHMLERRRQRRTLLQLDDRQLADIGVSREQARREAEKWFWM